MPLETSITGSIITYIKSLGGQAEKVKGDSSSSGRPDINACYRGRCLRIEVKTPDHKNTASKKQEVNIKHWRHAGAICMIVYSKKAVMYFLTCYNRGLSGVHLYTESNGCVSTGYIPRVKE